MGQFGGIRPVAGVIIEQRRLGSDPALLAAGYRWHVLHTRCRHEKTVADILAGAGAQVYVPVQRRVTWYGHRKRTVEVPLFSCYVFAWGLLEHAYLATASKHAARVIPVADQTRLGEELSNLCRAAEAGGHFLAGRLLNVGRRVRVTSGPFEGIEGMVERIGSNDRLMLQVHAIGRALGLEIDASLLEPVD
jgi:hypothetical protein